MESGSVPWRCFLICQDTKGTEEKGVGETSVEAASLLVIRETETELNG